MNPRVGAVLLLWMGAAAVARSQSAAALAGFDVASIRPCSGGSGSTAPPSPGRLTVNCSSLRSLIGIAFGTDPGTLRPRFITVVLPEGSDRWIESDLYTVDAKAEDREPLPGNQVMRGPMLQALLAERFKLRVRWEVRTMPVYALRVGRSGPRLTPVERNCEADVPVCGTPFLYNNGFELLGATMEQFATELTRWASDRRVLDETGIVGRFDIHFDWSNGATSREPLRLGAIAAPEMDRGLRMAGAPAALDDLGLRLQATEAPGDFLIVEHFERPTQN